MAGICFYFEEYDVDVWSGRRIDLDAWNYAAKAAGDIDRMCVVNRTETLLTNPDADMGFEVVSEIPELEGRVAYIACPWDPAVSQTSLWDFDHQVDWYVFGPANGWGGWLADKPSVVIPQAGRAACHAVHVATVVLMHRHKVLQWP